MKLKFRHASSDSSGTYRPRKRVAIMMDLDWPFRRHFDVFTGTQHYAEKCGEWDCVIDEFAHETLRAARKDDRPYDGVIARATSELALQARRRNIPVVNVWVNSPARDLPSVFPHCPEMGGIAADHLLERGFRHFACLSGHGDNAQRMELDEFHKRIRQAGYRCQCCVVPRQYQRNKSVWKATMRTVNAWVTTWKTPTAALITFPDAMGRHVAEVVTQQGLIIPEQVALLLTENDPALCMHPPPSISSIDIPYVSLGFKAAELLDQLMQDRTPRTLHIQVEPSGITARQSTDFLAVEDQLVASALRFISRSAHRSMGIDDVCKEVYVGRRTLERRFRNILGRTVGEEIRRLRLERAKRELAQDDTAIKQIALRAGFSNAKRLHEVFRRELGESPSEYRQRVQVKL